MYGFSFFVGAFIAIWIISRFVRRVLFRKSSRWKRVFGPNLLALVIATGLGGVGFADAGSLQFLNAFLQYFPAVVAWVALDAWRGGERRAATSSALRSFESTPSWRPTGRDPIVRA